jgi:hypothetical protein
MKFMPFHHFDKNTRKGLKPNGYLFVSYGFYSIHWILYLTRILQ